MSLPPGARPTSGIPALSKRGSRAQGLRRRGRAGRPGRRERLLPYRQGGSRMQGASSERREGRQPAGRSPSSAAMRRYIRCGDFGADMVLGQAEKFDAARYLPGQAASSGLRGMWRWSRRRGRRREGPDEILLQDTGRLQPISAATASSLSREAPSGRARQKKSQLQWRRWLTRGMKEVVLTGIDLAAWRDPHRKWA